MKKRYIIPDTSIDTPTIQFNLLAASGQTSSNYTVNPYEDESGNQGGSTTQVWGDADED